jgi:hypothetical protein
LAFPIAIYRALCAVMDGPALMDLFQPWTEGSYSPAT